MDQSPNPATPAVSASPCLDSSRSALDSGTSDKSKAFAGHGIDKRALGSPQAVSLGKSPYRALSGHRGGVGSGISGWLKFSALILGANFGPFGTLSAFNFGGVLTTEASCFGKNENDDHWRKSLAPSVLTAFWGKEIAEVAGFCGVHLNLPIEAIANMTPKGILG